MSSPNVIDLCGDDDDDDDVILAPAPLPRVPKKEDPCAHIKLPRKFWNAGDYNYTPASIPLQGGMDHVRIHPKFLHTNATSHKWALGAIAELLDNAVDEMHHGATFVKIDKALDSQNRPMLVIEDDGGGMNPEALRRCMSFGFSAKPKNSIGQYGNGFKTSTMRIGADVIVFTRNEEERTQSVGLLSYSYLTATCQEDIYVPMIDFSVSAGFLKPRRIVRSHKDDWLLNFHTITRWSPFRTEADLFSQFPKNSHGTKIIIYNLWQNEDGEPELDFDADEQDIQLSGGGKIDADRVRNREKEERIRKHISHRLKFSLRAYASVLYLRPLDFRIFLRGKEVRHFSIVSDLKYPEDVQYRPQSTNSSSEEEIVTTTTIGFVKEAPLLNVHGFSVYNHNRLIMPFWKVLHTENSSRGTGVVGVLEANFIHPAHDKQGFEASPLFAKLENRLKHMTYEYWNSHCTLIGYQGSASKRNIKNNARAESRAAEPPPTPPRPRDAAEAVPRRRDAVRPLKELHVSTDVPGNDAEVPTKSVVDEAVEEDAAEEPENIAGVRKKRPRNDAIDSFEEGEEDPPAPEGRSSKRRKTSEPHNSFCEKEHSMEYEKLRKEHSVLMEAHSELKKRLEDMDECKRAEREGKVESDRLLQESQRKRAELEAKVSFLEGRVAELEGRARELEDRVLELEANSAESELYKLKLTQELEGTQGELLNIKMKYVEVLSQC